jgi:acetyl-CoA acetyltransferase family protein
MSALLAGLSIAIPGVTVNRLCGSGMQAIADGARQIACGEAEVIVAGGVEHMTRAPLVMAKPDAAYPRGNHTLFDTTLGWRFVNPRMTELHETLPMGETAERVARQCNVTRDAQDRLALQSQLRAAAATASGRLAQEIVAITTGTDKKGVRLEVTADEHPRADTTIESLTKLRPAFAKDGTVTAGNASGLNDGAAAVLLASEAAIARYQLTPQARYVTSAVAGVAPSLMGLGPIPASEKALAKAGLRSDAIDVAEINEAFAAQAVPCIEQLGLDPDRVNVNGGAIAIGHPLGASGARLVLTLARELANRKARHGLASMCIGVGQGIALILERA